MKIHKDKSLPLFLVAFLILAQGAQCATTSGTLKVGFQPSEILFTPDNKFLLCLGWDAVDNPKGDGYVFEKSPLQWWDVKGRALRKTVIFRDAALMDISISPDGKFLASAHETHVRIWNVHTGHVVQLLRTKATSVAFSSDSQTLASAGEPVASVKGKISSSRIAVKLWNTKDWTWRRTLAKGNLPDNLKNHEVYYFVHSIAFTEANSLVAVTDSYTILWNTETGKEKMSDWIPSSEVTSSPDGKTVAFKLEEHVAAQNFNSVYSLWNASTFKPRFQLLSKDQKKKIDAGRKAPTPGNSVAFSPDNKTVAVGFGDAFLGLYDVETGVLKKTISENHEHYSTALAFSSDGRLLASGNHNQTVELFKLKN